MPLRVHVDVVSAEELIFSGETDAAMVPSYIAQTYPNLVPIATTREFVGRAFSAGPNVPADVRKKVTEALLRLHKEQSRNRLRLKTVHA